MSETNLGHATAYGYAKSKGYTGTEEEFAEMLANLDSDAETASAAATSAATSATTASTKATEISDKISDANSIMTRAVTNGKKRYSMQYLSTTSVSSETFNPTGYTWSEVDVFSAYKNGEKIVDSTVTAEQSGTVTIVRFDPAVTMANGDILEIVCDGGVGLSVDDTLSVDGAAADSKATGDAIDDVKADLNFWGGKDLLESLTKSSFTNKGITWAWNGNLCTVNGTATATANNDIYSSPSVMPTGFEAGETYHVYYSSTNINLRIYAYHSAGGSTELCSTKTDIDLTIPTDAIGMIIRLNIPSGTVVNETVGSVISTNYTTSKLLDVIEKNTIITPKPVETISVDMLEKGGWAAGSKTDSRSENRARTKMLLYASKPIDIYRKYDYSNALIFTHYYDITGAVISSASWAQSAFIPEGSIFSIIITESNSSLTERTVNELYNMFHIVTVNKEIITDYNSAQWTFSRGGISSNNNWLYDIQNGKQVAVNQYFKVDKHFVRISCETGYSVALIGYNEQFEIVKKQTDFGDKTGTVYVDMEGCSYFRCFVVCPSVSTTEEDILNNVSITKNEPISVE